MLKLNPARPFGARERWGTQNGSNATVLTSLGLVDVVQHLPGLPAWPRLTEEAELYELDGMRVAVVNRRTLIELKHERGSKLDFADIEAIELLPSSSSPDYACAAGVCRPSNPRVAAG